MAFNELMADIEELRKWVEDNRIEAHVSDSFEKAFEAYKTDCQEEFQSLFPAFEKIKLAKTLVQVSLSIASWGEEQYEQDCIIVYLKIEYDNKHAIDYREVFDLDGRKVDSYLTTLNTSLSIGGIE